MNWKDIQYKGIILTNSALQIVVFFFIVLLIGNLNAIVDRFLHPEIPYFDEEHLIVGGITALVSATLFGLLMLYTHYLRKALSEVKILESFLPICVNCKKIQIPDTDPSQMESWQQIEYYISENTATEFSHGICPECRMKLYPELYEKE